MRVTYLDAAILDLNRTPLPQCEGVDGFDCCDPAIVFNVDARQYFCGPHHRFWEKHYQSHDPYEFGTFKEVMTYVGYKSQTTTRDVTGGHRAVETSGCTCDWHEEPQTLVEYVIEYMQKQGM